MPERAAAYHELATELDYVTAAARPEWLAAHGHCLLAMVTDVSQPALAVGLASATALVGAASGPICDQRALVAAIVDVALSSPRIDVRIASRELLLTLCWVDTPAPVVVGVAAGFGARVPRAAAAAVSAARAIVRAYGTEHIDATALLAALQGPFAHKSNDLRTEARLLAVELFRWVGPDVATSLQYLPPILRKELEAQFAAAAADPPPKQERLLRSQVLAAASDCGVAENDDDVDDPWDTAEPVATAQACPRGFLATIASPAWKERKSAAELLYEGLRLHVRLETDGGTSALVGALGELVDDVHVAVSLFAIRCLSQLALKLRGQFSVHVPSTLPLLIGRFKVRKMAVVCAVREAVDACFSAAGHNLSAISTAFFAAAAHKNPQVRAETHSFLQRCLASAALQLDTDSIKTYGGHLAIALEDCNGAVRDAAAECLGTLIRVTPDGSLRPLTKGIGKSGMHKVHAYASQADVAIAHRARVGCPPCA
ncbi:hypothetical protein LPJ61_005762 [Coemansia biformis]|uniref:TOG domain-containing protein n=1 Tax=Coemansia biformis TaxID=1286918 RepID=A0A9W7XZW4_9FUNG|nr:hypothetical protein LPJ61_005762 [Coemansia biformis]